jgi:hypothetical protein
MVRAVLALILAGTPVHGEVVGETDDTFPPGYGGSDEQGDDS